MKLRIKIAMLGLGAALLGSPWMIGSEACAKMLGDFLGDALFLSMVD